MTISPILNIIGLVFDIIGAIFVAYEVINIYNKEKFIPNDQEITTDEDIIDGFSDLGGNILYPSIRKKPKETEGYILWKKQKHKYMSIGLAFLLLGFLIQIYSNCLQI